MADERPQTDWEVLTAMVTTQEERDADRRLIRVIPWLAVLTLIAIGVVLVALIPR